jgi:FkbM family methyltransferase
MVDFYNQYPYDLESSYWLTKSNKYLIYQDELFQCSEIWADIQSQLLFNSILRHRFWGDYSVLPEPDGAHQYFPQDLSNWKKSLRFVDCGAYDGDTLRLARNLYVNIESVFAFEPDEKNFKVLSDYLRDQKYLDYKALQLGVYSTSKEIGFLSEGSEGSKISEKNTNQISVVSLDDVLSNFYPNYIKMDIEGAEIEALKGAQKTIENYRPGLAICVYHHPQHLWQIPLLIHRWELNYKLYLRIHAYNGFDVVMYAFAV